MITTTSSVSLSISGDSASYVNPESIRSIRTVAAGLVRSDDPMTVFGSLATSLARHTGTHCAVELVTDSGVSRFEASAAPRTASDCVGQQASLSPVARQLLSGDGQPLSGPDWFAVAIGAAASPLTTGADAESQCPIGVLVCRYPARRAEHDQAELVQLLVSLASDVLVAERQLSKARDQVKNLEIALTSNRDIGTAVGILMNSHLLTQEEAFTTLRMVSQHSHRKLREVANEVIFTGALDVPKPKASGLAG